MRINSRKITASLKRNFFVLLGAVAILLVLGSVTQADKAKITETASAQTAEKFLAGWAWSDNVGWISFSCVNDNSCSKSSYAVKISDSTGNFSGWAWSDNVGWISFNETTGCPEAGCETQPRLSMSTKKITGWAKALSFGGGWDGWIKLGGSWPESAYLAPAANFAGYSWGAEVVGWMKWDAAAPPNINTCPDGSPVPADGICINPDGSKTCSDGSPVPASGVCPSGGTAGTPTGGSSGPCPSGGVCICQTDASGNCVVDIKENRRPVAVIVIPAESISVSKNSSVNFDAHDLSGGGSYDPDGDNLIAYEWRESDCTSGRLISPLSRFATVFPVGLHEVFLRVKDTGDAWSTNCPSVTIAVEVPLPINGVCGPAAGTTVLNKPASGLCSSPVPASGVNGSGPWTWTCPGDEGGTPATCTTFNSCGNNICDQDKGENPATCREDCPLNVREF